VNGLSLATTLPFLFWSAPLFPCPRAGRLPPSSAFYHPSVNKMSLLFFRSAHRWRPFFPASPTATVVPLFLPAVSFPPFNPSLHERHFPRRLRERPPFLLLFSNGALLPSVFSTSSNIVLVLFQPVHRGHCLLSSCGFLTLPLPPASFSEAAVFFSVPFNEICVFAPTDGFFFFRGTCQFFPVPFPFASPFATWASLCLPVVFDLFFPSLFFTSVPSGLGADVKTLFFFFFRYIRL